MKIEVNGMQLAYETREGVGPPIVLVHGFGLDRSIWRLSADKHLSSRQVILPDVRGHGGSDAPKGPYPIAALAQDLAQLIDLLGFERVVVCGHSMGGYVALAFAKGFPHRLAGLGLITTNAGSDSAEKRAGRYALIEEVRQRGSVAVAERLAPKLSHNPVVIDEAYRLICQTSPQGLIGALEGMAERPDRSALLRKIDVPALVVAGEDDQIADLEGARAMAATLPKGAFVSLPGVGHMPMLEAPGALGSALQSLMDRVNN